MLQNIPSIYQIDIFKEIKEGSQHLVVEALAGSGKTTTLVESLKYIPERNSCFVGAFNTKIAEELKLKVPERVDVSTLHGVGLKSIKKAYGKDIVIEKRKTELILEKIINKDEEEDIYTLVRAVSLAKNILAQGYAKLEDMMETYQIYPNYMNLDRFIYLIEKCLNISKDKYKIIDFDDMPWLCYINNLPAKYYDCVMIDEAQDINPAQFQLIIKMLGSKGRCFAWGDPNQSLYSFRGADPEIMNKFKQILDATTLSLPITYRCASNIVDLAKELVPSYTARPGAPEGKVEEMTYPKMLETIQPGCFIISRTNAPLFRTAMRLLQAKKPCNIQGKDLQEHLLSIIRNSKAKKITKFLVYLEKWYKKQVEANPKSAGYAQDKYESICALADGLDTTQELIEVINHIFIETDEKDKIILGTTHALKGLERDVVYMLTNTYSTYNQEERNCKYTAITRAKNYLYLVEYQR